jgi:RecA-family ATPase
MGLGYTRSQERPSPKPQPVNDAAGETAPFEIVDAGDLENVPVEEPRYLVKDWIPLGEPGIFSGAGGAGKSRMMKQLGVAASLEWPDWLGLTLEEYGSTVGFTAEEMLKPYHRHLKWILQSRGASLADLKGRYHIIAPPSPDNQALRSKWSPILGRVDHDGRVVPTPTLSWLEKAVKRIRPALVLVENAVDVYAGNHNEPPQVAQFVREILGGLCQWGATMALNQHPSVSGQIDGSGRSATVAWENAGRWRIYSTKAGVATNDDKFVETGRRQLQLMKINEGASGAKTQVHWDKDKHLWVPTGAGNPLERAAAEAPVNDAFLRCLDAFTAQGRTASDSPGRNYAPAQFEKMPEANGTTKRAFELAMPRLFTDGRIVVRTEGKGCHAKKRLTRA